MTIFAVIRVRQCCEDVEGCDCVMTYPTEQEAQDYVQKEKDEWATTWNKKREYVEAFVENIKLPDTDYKGWLEFLETYKDYLGRYTFPKDFKKELTSSLIRREAKLEGFSPPAVTGSFNNLFVVEIRT